MNITSHFHRDTSIWVALAAKTPGPFSHSEPFEGTEPRDAPSRGYEALCKVIALAAPLYVTKDSLENAARRPI